MPAGACDTHTHTNVAAGSSIAYAATPLVVMSNCFDSRLGLGQRSV